MPGPGLCTRSKSSKAIGWLLRAWEALDDSSLPPGPALHSAFPLSRRHLAQPSPTLEAPWPRSPASAHTESSGVSFDFRFLTSADLQAPRAAPTSPCAAAAFALHQLASTGRAGTDARLVVVVSPELSRMSGTRTPLKEL